MQCSTTVTINYFSVDVTLNLYSGSIKSIKSQLPLTETVTTFVSVAFNLVCSLGDICPGGEGVPDRSGRHFEISCSLTEI